MTDRYSFDAWGNLVSHVGNTEQPYQYAGKYGYYTHTQDANLKMMQLGVRLYDAETGRFVQKDPLVFTDSYYAYSFNKPMRYVDANGKWIIPVVIGGIVIWTGGCSLYSLFDTLIYTYWDGNQYYNGRDKLAHCVTACNLRKCGTIVMSWFWGVFKELIWEYFDPLDIGDWQANGEGEQCAVTSGTNCHDCCTSIYPKPCPESKVNYWLRQN